MTLDATRILPKLYMGSRPPTGHQLRLEGFDVLVLCAGELQLPASHFPGVEVLHLPLRDVSHRPFGGSDWDRVVLTSQRVQRRLRDGKRVLVTCAMGLNRSGIVTATTVHLMTGVSGAKAVDHVQALRAPGGQKALFNVAFVRALVARLPDRKAA
jgi:protein-tyrosine phosphatase